MGNGPFTPTAQAHPARGLSPMACHSHATSHYLNKPKGPGIARPLCGSATSVCVYSSFLPWPQVSPQRTITMKLHWKCQHGAPPSGNGHYSKWCQPTVLRDLLPSAPDYFIGWNTAITLRHHEFPPKGLGIMLPKDRSVSESVTA